MVIENHDIFVAATGGVWETSGLVAVDLSCDFDGLHVDPIGAFGWVVDLWWFIYATSSWEFCFVLVHFSVRGSSVVFCFSLAGSGVWGVLVDRSPCRSWRKWPLMVATDLGRCFRTRSVVKPGHVVK